MHVSRKTFYLEVEATDDIFALIDVQYAKVKRFRFQKPRVPTHLICIDKLFVVFFVNIAKNSKNRLQMLPIYFGYLNRPLVHIHIS